MSFLIITAIAGTLIALLPGLIIFIFIARKTETMWLGAILGGIFWLAALLARTPLLLIIDIVAPIIPPTALLLYVAFALFFASLLAGLFEEGFRFLFLRWQPKFIETVKHALTFGLGWGLGEAIMVYALDVLTIAFFYPLLIDLGIILPPEPILMLNIMFGAVERNIAIVFHVTATIFVAIAVWHRKPIYLGFAIAAHFLFNFVPISLYRFVLLYIMDSITAAIV
ncbi:MAG: YhfC family glutamic-type intramembrane protease, partial [Candidatus Hermodarchaeota archaeon]|nr:YhfC family glutamic-type intramembrane protease [Candidatus Hermodarchaeota archaeon]